LLHEISVKHISFGSSLATIILRPVATHTHQIEENDTHVSMLSNTIASPFGDLSCLHTIESKNSQPPTKKKQAPPEKP
jgi:hypothetical protein